MASGFSNIDIKVMGDGIVTDAKRMNIPVNTFAMKVDGRGDVMKGDTVQVPILTKPADAIAYNASSNNYTTDNGETEDVKSVVLSQHFKKSFIITGAQINRLGEVYVAEKLRSYMDAMDTAVMADVLSLVTNANFGTAGLVGAASTFDATDMNNLRAVLEVSTGTAPLTAIIDTSYYSYLLEDATLKNALNYGSPLAAQQGILTGVRGISETYRSNLIPANSENLKGFVMAKGALLFGLAIPQNPTELDLVVDYQIVTNPVNGMTYGIYKQIDLATHGLVIGVEAIWGKSVGTASFLTRITSA